MLPLVGERQPVEGVDQLPPFGLGGIESLAFPVEVANQPGVFRFEATDTLTQHECLWVCIGGARVQDGAFPARPGACTGCSTVLLRVQLPENARCLRGIWGLPSLHRRRKDQ